MANLTVSGICRLTRDAEIRKSTTGTWYGVGLASYRRNAKEGKQSIDFFEAEIYQKVPPLNFEKMLSKGRLIFIENGYLKNDQFVGTDGKDKSRVKIQISTYELLNDKVDAPKVDTVEVKTEKISVSNSVHPSDMPPPPNAYGGMKKKIVPQTEEVVPVVYHDEEIMPEKFGDEPPF